MAQFIGDHRGAHGVEPICNVLPIAPATYYEHLAKRANPAIYKWRSKYGGMDASLISQMKAMEGKRPA